MRNSSLVGAHSMSSRSRREPIVITGIGMTASVGTDREAVWQAVGRGESGVRTLAGLPGVPEGLLIGAPVDIEPEYPGQLKAIALSQRAADEAIRDAEVDLGAVDLDRFGCAISSQMGDTSGIAALLGYDKPADPTARVPWWQQWMPNTACTEVANRYRLAGPRMSHSVACASGLVEVLSAVRAIRDNQCDIALAGSAEAFHPLLAAGFRQMKVLAHHDDPRQACRPFDLGRQGFVMGEGSAMLVLERLSHAVARGATIYAEVAGGKMLAEAHHVTSMDAESEVLAHLISVTLRDAELVPGEIGYINAHGTGTHLNDVVESRGIRRAFGRAADQTCVSATKSMLGHLINAAGIVELAITVLALRDGFAPPTLNLTDQDPKCDLDCLPLVGRNGRYENALKLSVAFGGHLAAVALSRWDNADARVATSRHAAAA